MHTKPKLGKRLTSLLMSVIMTLTSVAYIVQVQEPIITHAAGKELENNNLIYSADGYIANLTSAVVNDCAEPEYQMLRISLIQVGADAASADGHVNRYDSTIVNNPISVWSSQSAGANYNNAQIADTDKIRQLVNPKWNTSTSGDVSHRLNTRRDYQTMVLDENTNSYVLAYGTTWVPQDPDHPENGGNWTLFNGSEEEDASYYESSYIPVYEDDSIPYLISGAGDLKSYYQEHPPAEYPEWGSTSMDNLAFFNEYTQASFVPTDTKAQALGITEQVPDFTFRMLAKMMGYTKGPYADATTYAAVKEAYQTYINDGNYRILCEPMLTFRNDGGNSIVNILFGPGVSHISLTAGELGIVEDANSGINYGYTSKSSLGSEYGDGYNFFTGDGSPTRSACANLFTSMVLSSTEWRCGLWSMFDTGAHGSESGIDAQSQFQKNVKSFGGSYYTENFMYIEEDSNKGCKSTNDYGDALSGKLQGTTDVVANPYWNSIFYTEIYERLYDSKNYNADKAMEYRLDTPDPASFVAFGAMGLIQPQYDKIDIKTSLVGVGEPEEEINGIPVYPNSYATNNDEYLSGSLTISGSMQLNFDDGSTSWDSPIITHVNNGSPSDTLNPDYEPDYITMTCTPMNDSNAADPTNDPTYRYVHDQNDESYNFNDNFQGDVYIPGFTKAEITVTYANEDGEPIIFNQIDGAETEYTGESIYLNSGDIRGTKLFIDNIANLGFYRDADDENKAIPFYVSRSNSDDVLNDKITYSDFIEDVGTEAAANLANNLNDYPDADKSKYISIKTLPAEYVPEDAAYYLVTLKANIGYAQKHSDSSFELYSRPQYYEEGDASGASTVNYYATYTDTACSGQVISTGLETDFTNNTSQILIPIESPEYDVSADSIDINYSTESVLPSGSTDTSDARDHLTSLCLISEGSATEEVIADYGDQVTSNIVYMVASTSPADTSAIYDIDDKDSLLNASTALSKAVTACDTLTAAQQQFMTYDTIHD